MSQTHELVQHVGTKYSLSISNWRQSKAAPTIYYYSVYLVFAHKWTVEQSLYFGQIQNMLSDGYPNVTGVFFGQREDSIGEVL
jgi:hypothetical protein